MNELNERLIKATRSNDLKTVKLSIKQGADIHTGCDSALRLSSQQGSLEIVKFLVENGANIHASGDWALHYSLKHGHQEVVEYLADKYGYRGITKYLIKEVGRINRRHIEEITRINKEYINTVKDSLNLLKKEQ